MENYAPGFSPQAEQQAQILEQRAAEAAQPPMDPMRRMLLARLLMGGEGGGMAPIPQNSPIGAGLTGIANGMRMADDYKMQAAIANLFKGQ